MRIFSRPVSLNTIRNIKAVKQISMRISSKKFKASAAENPNARGYASGNSEIVNGVPLAITPHVQRARKRAYVGRDCGPVALGLTGYKRSRRPPKTPPRHVSYWLTLGWNTEERQQVDHKSE